LLNIENKRKKSPFLTIFELWLELTCSSRTKWNLHCLWNCLWKCCFI